MTARVVAALILLGAGCGTSQPETAPAPAPPRAAAVQAAPTTPEAAVERLREARKLATGGDVTRAREAAQSVAPEAERSGWWEIAADAHFMVGEMRDRERVAREAADAYARSFDASRRVADAPRGVRALNALANAFIDAGALDKSVEVSQEALRLAQRGGILGGQATALNNLGEAHRLGGRHAEAAENYTRALRLARQAEDRRAELAILMNLGAAERRLGRPENARRHFTTAREIGLALNDAQAVSYARWNLEQIEGELKGKGR
jgi:tetratricopeptide (TPR) repeat protein